MVSPASYVAEVSAGQQVDKEGKKRAKKTDKHRDFLVIQVKMQSLLSFAAGWDIGKLLEGKAALRAGKTEASGQHKQ